jgi:hypothetical protein
MKMILFNTAIRQYSSYYYIELTKIIMLLKRRLYSKPRKTDKHFVSVYRVYCVSTDNILRWTFEMWYSGMKVAVYD